MRDDQSALEQVAWTAAGRLGEFDYRALAAEAQIGYDTVGVWVRRWLRQGKVEALGKQGGVTLRFRIAGAPAAPVPAPAAQKQTGLGNMWRAMRNFRAPFSPTDVGAHATTDIVQVSREEAQAFCQLLVRAGYLRVLRKAIPGKREAIYRLIRDTGPRPPRERRVRAVWDDNLGEFTHLPVAESGGDA